jgi:hypothetical protein
MSLGTGPYALERGLGAQAATFPWDFCAGRPVPTTAGEVDRVALSAVLPDRRQATRGSVGAAVSRYARARVK